MTRFNGKVDRINSVGAAMHPFLRQWAARELEVERAWRDYEARGRKAVRR